MPISALTIPARTQGGGDPPVDVNTIVAKVNEIATAVGAATISIPTRTAGGGTRDLFRTDMNTILAKVDEIAPGLSIATTGLSAWSLGYSITEEHTRLNTLVTKTNQLAAAAGSSSLRRPFSSSSPWNQTLATLYPGGIPVLTSHHTVRRNLIEPTNSPNNPAHTHYTGSTSTYTYPVYLFDASTPRVTVAYNGVRGVSTPTENVRTTGPGTHLNVPIIAGLKPSLPVPSGNPTPNGSGGDSQLILWNPATGEYYDFWQCAQNGDGTWYANGSGEYVVRNMTHFTGNDATWNAVPATTPDSYISRGAGVPYMAGLVRKWEVDAGVIQHAIAMAFDWPSDKFVSPASKSDGVNVVSPGDYSTHMPEGGRFKLADWFPVSSLSSSVARAVAQAMKDYGVIAIDNSGNTKIMAESDLTVPGAGTADWGGVWNTNLMREVPHWAFVAIDPAGSSSLREADLPLYDPSASVPDPLATAPVILETQTGVQSTAGLSVSSAAFAAVNQNELLIASVSIRGNSEAQVTAITGCSATWTRVHRTWDLSNVQAIAMEVWIGRVGASPTPSAVDTTLRAQNASINPNGSAIISVQRMTVNATIRRIMFKDTGYETTFAGAPGGASNSTSVTIPDTTTNSLVLGVLTTRDNPSTTDFAGTTAVGSVLTSGSGGTALSQRIYSKAGGGSITINPTYSSDKTRSMIALEVT